MANAGGPLPSALLLILCEGKQCGRGLLAAQCSRCPIYFLVWKCASPVEDGMRWAEPEAGKIASDVLVVTFSKPLENFFSLLFFFSSSYSITPLLLADSLDAPPVTCSHLRVKVLTLTRKLISPPRVCCTILNRRGTGQTDPEHVTLFNILN